MKLRILVPPPKTYSQTMYIVETHKEHKLYFINDNFDWIHHKMQMKKKKNIYIYIYIALLKYKKKF